MGDIKKMAALEEAIRRACKGYKGDEVGSVLSAMVIDFARHTGMPKDVFASMILAFWDEFDDHMDDMDKVEMH
tara:strand:- start:3446 stop:3664 length:219 start_codon:yes stop_codon:yes gene_type:complete